MKEAPPVDTLTVDFHHLINSGHTPDSILPAAFAPSMLVSHYRAVGLSPRVRQSDGNDWASLILALCLVLLAIVQVFFRRRFGMIVRAFLANRFVNQLVREGEVFNERLSINLFVIYILTASLFLFWTFTSYLGYPVHGIARLFLFAKILAVFISLWALRMLVIRMVGTIFKTASLTYDYLLNILIFNFIEGIVLMFLLIPLLYLDSVQVFYFVLVVLGLISLYRFARAVIIGLAGTSYSVLYFIVFIATLEVLPVLVLTKIFLLPGS